MAQSQLDDANHWIVRFAKGHLIYDEGDSSETMFRVERGCVRLQVNGLDGERQIARFLLAGDTFGFSTGPRVSAAEAATDVELTCFSIRSILNRSAESPDLLVELLNTANSFYGDLAHHLEAVAHRPAADRLIEFVRWLAAREAERRPGAASLILPMTYRDIGDFLGLGPETLSRALRTLTEQGLLERDGRRGFHLGAALSTRATRLAAGRRSHPRAADGQDGRMPRQIA